MTSVPTALRRGVAVVAALVVAGTIAVVGAPPASAHAALRETTPFDGQTVPEAPDEVRWTFNEEVTSTSGALRIFDRTGQRVDTGEQTHPAPEQLTVGMREDVGRGSYVATYRVASADGHLIRGAFVFQVGDGAAIDEDTVAALFAGGQDTVVTLAAGVTRAAGYLGALLSGGALLWSIVVARGRREEQARGDRWAWRGAVLAAVAAAVVVPVQAMLSSGAGLGVLADSRVLTETLTAPVGLGAVLRLVAAVTVVVLLQRGGDAARDVAGAAGLVVLAAFLVDGHTRTVGPVWVMVLGDAVHLMAGAAWFGGLVVLGGTLRSRRSGDEPVGAADVVARFSRVATWSLVAVALAGGAMSWAAVRQPRALVSTDYGWTLLVKVGLVAVVVTLGIYNNRRLVPAITRAATSAGASVDATTDPGATDPAARARIGRAAWARLGGIVRFEAVVLVAVLAVTAFLVNLRPAADEAGITGAFDTLVAVDEDLQLNLVVDPNRVGHNDIHFYVLDRTGRPHSDLASVAVELTQPERDIGPIVREPFVAGPGHWQLEGNDLAVPGEWIIELVLGTDRFTEERVAVPVVVNP